MEDVTTMVGPLTRSETLLEQAQELADGDFEEAAQAKALISIGWTLLRILYVLEDADNA